MFVNNICACMHAHGHPPTTRSSHWSQSFLLHNCSMKFLRRIAACFGNVAFMIHISGQIIAALGAGGIVGPFPWVEYWKQGSWSFVAIMVYQEPHPERAWGLLFLWLVLSLPDYMLLPTGSCNCSSFFPFLFYPQTLFFQSYWWWLRLCFTVNNMFCR